jgi:L-malate glycosyltransferase
MSQSQIPDTVTAPQRSLLVLMPSASSWAQMVVEHLATTGFAVHVVDFNPPLGTNPEVTARAVAGLREKVNGVHLVAPAGPFAWRLVQGARKLRALARETGAEMVLTLYGGMQAAIAWLSGVRPYAVYVVGSDVLLADRIRRLISRRSIHGAATVLANGGYLADRTRAIAPGAKVEALYFGIDLTRFRPTAVPVTAAHFVCSRVFHEVYDNATIVRAIGHLSDLPADFGVHFLSSGPLLQPTIVLADQTLEPGARQTVAFAGGVSDEELVTSLRSSRFYLSASRSDGASASLLEGMACGLFPIVTDIPANREWVTHGKNGLLFKPGDHLALADAMNHAMREPAMVAGALDTNTRLVAERANMEINLKRLSQVILQHCARQRKMEGH